MRLLTKEAIELAGGVAKKCPLQKIENENVPASGTYRVANEDLM